MSQPSNPIVRPRRPAVAVTMGDPAGVGPEVCLRVLAMPEVLERCCPVVVGDRRVLQRVAQRLDLSVPDPAGERPAGTGPGIDQPGVWHIPNVDIESLIPGRVDPACGRAAYEYIEAAVTGCRLGRFQAVATCPVHKEALHRAGVALPGHTEILARLTGVPEAAMMLYSPCLAVSFVTIHVPLATVPESLSVDGILRIVRLTDHTLRRLRARRARIAVLGLNPHAGEHGLFGHEEQHVIVPAIRAACAEGIDAHGPLPPDTAFTPAALERYGGHVCMYHDQGAIPLKTLSFEQGVNITMGLPIVRTSVDHGTAFDIAWTGQASPESLKAAVLLAVQLVHVPA